MRPGVPGAAQLRAGAQQAGSGWHIQVCRKPDRAAAAHVFGTATRPRQPNVAHSRIGRNRPLTAYVLVRGLPSLVWQVLGSNQRRLSRRFCRPLANMP